MCVYIYINACLRFTATDRKSSQWSQDLRMTYNICTYIVYIYIYDDIYYMHVFLHFCWNLIASCQLASLFFFHRGLGAFAPHWLSEAWKEGAGSKSWKVENGPNCWWKKDIYTNNQLRLQVGSLFHYLLAFIHQQYHHYPLMIQWFQWYIRTKSSCWVSQDINKRRFGILVQLMFHWDSHKPSQPSQPGRAYADSTSTKRSHQRSLGDQVQWPTCFCCYCYIVLASFLLLFLLMVLL